MNNEIFNYKGEELKNYVKNNASKELLESNELRNYLLEDYNHYAFVWLVQELDNESKSFLLNKDYLEKIINTDQKALYKFNVIMQSYPDCLKNTSELVMKQVLKPYNESDYHYFDIELASQIFDYILKKEQSKLKLIVNFNNDVLKELLTYENVIFLSKIDLFNIIIHKFDKEIIKCILKYDTIRSFIVNYSNYELIQFSESIKNISVEDELLNSHRFIQRISQIENPNIYRNIINNLLVNNYEITKKINLEREKYLKKKISNVNADGVFKEYEELNNYIEDNGIDKKAIDIYPIELYGNYKMSYDEMKKISSLRRFEYMCDELFEDYTYNVLINLNNIIEFDKKIPYLSEERRNLYKKILEFDKLSLIEQMMFLKKSINNSIADIYYDDFRQARDLSYKSIQDNLLDLNSRPELYDKEKSNPVVPIYRLEGENFVACVHCGNLFQEFKDTISLSVIGNEHIGVFNSNSIIFGFDNIKTDRITHAFHTDSFTSGKYGTNRVNKIYDVHDMLNKTRSCNEILYNTKVDSLKPSYIVCFDDIKEESYIRAVNDNLPIVVINSKKYNKNDGMYETENYQESYKKEDDFYGKRI